MLCKSMLTHELMDMVMEEYLPCLLCPFMPLMSFMFSYGLCDVGLMLYSLVEIRNMRDFLYGRKEFYVS